MEKHKLEGLISENKTTRDIASETGLSQTSIKYWLKKFGLKTNFLPSNKGGRNAENRKKIVEFGCAYKCKQCGETDEKKFMKMGFGRKSFTICKKCHNENNKDRLKKRKERFVANMGGQCVRCFYKKCINALEFHHIDPSKKDPKFECWKSFSDERVTKELEKCILVCSNCHREIHAGI